MSDSHHTLLRLAAIGDLHVGAVDVWDWRAALSRVSEQADLLLLAGDLTSEGARREGELVLDALRDVTIPAFAVLGNHDHHRGLGDALAVRWTDAGIVVLEGAAAVVRIGGLRVGIAGAKGFGGGFRPHVGGEFGELEMKRFHAETRRSAAGLEAALQSLDTDLRLVLLHYAPVRATVRGEPRAIHPYLGSSLLADAVDRTGADLVIHGHAHAGTEFGATEGGVPVRNVAAPVLGAPYRIYPLRPASMAPERRA